MPEKKKRYTWLKYLFGGLLLLLVLLAVFYQPIIFGLAQFASQKIAKSQAFALQFRIHGSIFSDIYIEDIHLQPFPENKKFPIERADVKRIAARYNLFSFFKKDFLSVVDLVELKDVDVVIRPTPEAPRPKENQPIGPLKMALIIPKRIDLQNVNLTVRGDKGDLTVRKFALSFQQGQAGYIACGHLGIPGLAEWNDLRAGLNYQESQILLTDFKLDPILDLRKARIDLSGSANGKYGLTLDAAALEAPISAEATFSQIGSAAQLDAKANISSLDLQNLQKLAPIPVTGTLTEAEIALTGDLNHPTSISGKINIGAHDIRYQTYALEQAKIMVGIDQGRGTIQEISVHSGVNRIWAGGNFQLAEKIEELVTGSSVTIGLAAGFPDVSLYAPGVSAPTLIEGSVRLQDGKAKLILESTTSGIASPNLIPGLSVATANAKVFVTANIPLQEKLWPSIGAVFAGAIDKVAYQDVSLNQILIHGEAIDGKSATADSIVRSGSSSIRINGSLPLPYADHPFDPKEAEGQLRLDIANLSDFVKMQGAGTFTAKGNVKIAGLKPTGSIVAAGSQIKYEGLTVQNMSLNTEFDGNSARLNPSRIDFESNNYIQLNGAVLLTDPFPYQTMGEIHFQDLGTFNETLKTLGQDSALSGQLTADWSAKGDAKTILPNGALNVAGDQINYRGLTIRNANLNATLQDQKLDLSRLSLVFNDKNLIDGKANALLRGPYPYDANAKVDFDDLSFLNELLKSFGQDLGLGGKLHAAWTGNGEAKNSLGNLELHADEIKTKMIAKVKADLTGNYHGLNAEVPRLQISTPYADLETSIRLSPDFLEIPALTITKSGNTITGNVKIPVTLGSNAKTPLNLDGPLEINIRADKISLASFQPQPQVTGAVGFQIQASKTLRDPLIEITTTARDVRASSISSLKSANSDFLIRLADKVLTVSGKIEQPDINPVVVSGKVPLDVGQLIQGIPVPDETPLAFSVKWPNNNLAFIRKVVPDIKIMEGAANVDVNVSGTVKRPVLAGGIRATISRFQAKTDIVPPISDFITNVSLRDNRIQIEQLKGLAGGGPFSVSGAIDLSDGKDPKFTIGIDGRQVLLTRSDGLIARSNFALKIQGPLSAGVVSGTVGVTDSRFYKEIDILPLNLPGRPPPQPPAGALPKLAVDVPPFNNWKFDIAIRTDQPILIQSNLARGQVTINLKASGTGAAPSVTGAVRVDRLVASLPFSKMEIKNGLINFVPGGNILDPSLNMFGQSAVRDYEVRLRIFGSVSNPTVLLDSTPPLAQGDILVLLATGSTTAEFAQNPGLLAGRASFIVLQQLFGRFFPSTNRADEQKQPFIDRFDVEVIPGRKAGEQEISTRFKLTDNWQIIGDIGSASYQGRLKYLVRFR
jgi:hypothetical protein